MSTSVKESYHTRRKVVQQNAPISGHSHHSSNNTGNLENNLDALLEDLQTSVSRSTTPVRGGRALSPQVEYRIAANPTRVLAEGRSASPTRTTSTRTEKYVTTGQSGAPSGIPGLELLDAELQNVQPGQSKTVAYKQVSYQYNKASDGKPADSWAMSDNILNSSSSPFIEDVHESSYEESGPQRRHRSPDPASKISSTNRELLYSDSSSNSRSRQTSPLPASQQRDVKYFHESSNYQIDPVPVPSNVSTIRTNQSLNTSFDLTSNDRVPIPSPSPAIPINLAPGPKTKVTTTVKTYTYELPGSPENYLPGNTLPRGVVLPGDQTITYTLPRGGSTDKTVTYHTQTVSNASVPGKTVTYQVVPHNGPESPIRYTSPPPPEVTTKTTATHKEAKYYREEHHGDFPPDGQPHQQPPTTTIIYQTGPPPINTDTRTQISKDERYYQVNNNYPNGDRPRGPGSDHPDHPTNVIYENHPPIINETRTTTVNRIEEHYPNRQPYPKEPRHPTPDNQNQGTPTNTTVNYYTLPPQTNPPQTNTTIYKYSNTTTTIPPNRNADDHEVLLPKPFPIGSTPVYPSNSKPQSPRNGQGPPDKLEDLMASFSDTEREVLSDISNKERQQKVKIDTNSPKKEVEFEPHTPPKVQSKNVTGPPVYYPPGSAEFTKKEEYGGAMMQSSGGYQKASGMYEYEASSKSKSKSSSGVTAVPVCLPLCCAMPCVIM